MLRTALRINDGCRLFLRINASYAAIFIDDNIDDNNSTIILANGMTTDELNKEKSKTIDKAASARQIHG